MLIIIITFKLKYPIPGVTLDVHFFDNVTESILYPPVTLHFDTEGICVMDSDSPDYPDLNGKVMIEPYILPNALTTDFQFDNLCLREISPNMYEVNFNIYMDIILKLIGTTYSLTSYYYRDLKIVNDKRSYAFNACNSGDEIYIYSRDNVKFAVNTDYTILKGFEVYNLPSNTGYDHVTLNNDIVFNRGITDSNIVEINF